MVQQADLRHLRESALKLLQGNMRQGYDRHTRRRYAYVCPSMKRYAWQWLWDSCFHAVALSHLDLPLAKQELLNLVSDQQEDGFIGHVTYWGQRRFLPFWAYFQSQLSLRPHHTALIQPPVLARATWQVFQVDEDRGFLEAMLPRLNCYYGWLAQYRDPDGDGLISIISPYESGLDHSPAYDAALGVNEARPSRALLEFKLRRLDLGHLLLAPNYGLRRIWAGESFQVEDVMVNCIYAEGLRSLAGLNRAASDAAEAGRWDAKAQQVEAAILEKCFDPESGLYFGLEGRQERKHRVLTVMSLFPLILRSLPEAQAREIVRHLCDAEKFWLPYPAPSVACSEPSFDPRGERFLWRGPTWLNTNWFLVRGLRLHGFGDVAELIARQSANLVLRQGFREYYNPLTGQGLGAKDFGWSTLVVDMFRS